MAGDGEAGRQIAMTLPDDHGGNDNDVRSRTGGRATFSHYLDELNFVPSPFEQAMSMQQQQGAADYAGQQQQQPSYGVDADVDAELAMFAATDFIDFDTGLAFDQAALAGGVPAGPDWFLSSTATQSHSQSPVELDMSLSHLQQLQPHPQPHPLDVMTPAGTLPHLKQESVQQLLPSSYTRTDSISKSTGSPALATPVSATSTSTASTATTTAKPGNHADSYSRLAQEEDRRRRNTAASARFRIKKKEREKNMERMLKESAAKIAGLETTVAKLELENRWLKSLITEKSSWADQDLGLLFSKFRESAAAAAAAGGSADPAATSLGAMTSSPLHDKGEAGKGKTHQSIRPAPASAQPAILPRPQLQSQPQTPV
ncbi:hypothetical protein KEM52_004032 [Ascosphaera acerosa]|nr:hypothetical protein KEM52_004032 [Ascosphaera acerosa]